MAFLGSLRLRNINSSISSVAHAGETDPTGSLACLWPIPAAGLFLLPAFSLSLLPHAVPAVPWKSTRCPPTQPGPPPPIPLHVRVGIVSTLTAS